ncbi:synphilin-1 [Methylocaldum marinum]|uniref:Synphilin-1 n=1 Tax=Methylocaldum marinum TaxID=1432792 RepID=A0A250KXE4_9GAMM|nr:hypothetical protein [Methylocaldum marinum]BBA36272.1 synphilin-1 [Methylocaldum marinum]
MQKAIAARSAKDCRHLDPLAFPDLPVTLDRRPSFGRPFDGAQYSLPPVVKEALIKLLPYMPFDRLGRAFDKPVLSLSKGLS